MKNSFLTLPIGRNPLWNTFLDALFPPHCAGCEEWSREPFCPRCTPKLRRVARPWCDICGEPFDPQSFPALICARCRAKTPAFHFARSAFHFEGPARESIHRLKYGQKLALAARLSPLMKGILHSDADLQNFSFQLIVPVPLHSTRQRKRGFNQSTLLARSLSEEVGRPCSELLRRSRATQPQVGLSRDARAQNVRGAFEVDERTAKAIPFKGKEILLVDDVFTTGATLNECARVLKKAGAGEICALTLARR